MGKGRRSEKTEGAQETVARRGRIGGRLWVRHHKRRVERRIMLIYNVCLVERNKRVIAQNGQREATCGIERHFPLVSRVSIVVCVVFHLVLFSVRQSSKFLIVYWLCFRGMPDCELRTASVLDNNCFVVIWDAFSLVRELCFVLAVHSVVTGWNSGIL